MLVINLYGGPGCGKSTTAAGVFSLLKLHGVNAEYVPEFAKDLTWEERHKTLANQYYVWAKQYHRMWRLRDDVDVIVTDSPLLLTLIYGEICDTHRDTVIQTFNESFDNINYVLERVKPYNPKGRNQSEDEVQIIDSRIKLLLHKEHIMYKTVTGDYDGINNITCNLVERLKIEPVYKLQKMWNY